MLSLNPVKDQKSSEMGEGKEDEPVSSSYADKLPAGFWAVIGKRVLFKTPEHLGFPQ